MALSAKLEQHRSDILAIADRHGARQVRLFGSVARSESGPNSDVDLLVEFERGRSLVDQVALMQELEDLLGARADIVEPMALHPTIRRCVLEDAVPL